MLATRSIKPAATVTIEPTGPHHAIPREHSIKVLLRLTGSDPKYADTAQVAEVARKALSGFPPAKGEPDGRRPGEVVTSTRSKKTGNVTNIVIGVEGTALSPGRPADDSVDRIRDGLVDDGYHVTIKEKRECAEPGCNAFVVLDWNRLLDVPSGWHSNTTCGAHNYRTCRQCKSLYALSSTNAAGQAPSVHCEVCGHVLVEWGSSKVWTALLVTRSAYKPVRASD